MNCKSSSLKRGTLHMSLTYCSGCCYIHLICLPLCVELQPMPNEMTPTISKYLKQGGYYCLEDIILLPIPPDHERPPAIPLTGISHSRGSTHVDVSNLHSNIFNISVNILTRGLRHHPTKKYDTKDYPQQSLTKPHTQLLQSI